MSPRDARALRTAPLEPLSLADLAARLHVARRHDWLGLFPRGDAAGRNRVSRIPGRHDHRPPRSQGELQTYIQMPWKPSESNGKVDRQCSHLYPPI